MTGAFWPEGTDPCPKIKDALQKARIRIIDDTKYDPPPMAINVSPVVTKFQFDIMVKNGLVDQEGNLIGQFLEENKHLGDNLKVRVEE